MIVVDASALVAILLSEPDGEAYRESLLASADNLLSPVGYWEAATRLRSLKCDAGVMELDVVIRQLGVQIAPATEITARHACEAERLFGKRTPARLNLGDCFAYALAKQLDAPLLYKGDDFSRTDIPSARTG